MNAIDKFKELAAETRFQNKECYAFVAAMTGFLETESLDTLLAELSQYGNPRISLHDGGWHANVAMHVSAVGASFKVASEFNHDTPYAATRECLDRVIKTVNGLRTEQTKAVATTRG